MVVRRLAESGSGCANCRLGMAAGVGAGERCPWVDVHRPAGACLFVAGEAASRMLFVKRGAVTLSRESGRRRDDEVTWAVRRPGSLLGAEALVRDTYLDTARAVTDVLVCVASREDVDGWLRARPEAARAMLEVVMQAHCADAPRRSSSEGNAEERVASWLLEQTSDAAPLPRNVVAALLGMLPETLSRALAALATRGLIEVSRKHVAVLDAAALEAVAAGERPRG